MNVLRAIETRYKGCLFRSRLEARWAVYFDAVGLRWEHEREGYNLGDGIYYLPDFWLNDVQMWAEVKPAEFSDIEMEKVKRLTKQGGKPCVLLIGPPACKPYDFVVWCEDIGEWVRFDCLLSMYRDYPRSEHRFYCGPSGYELDVAFSEYGGFTDVKSAVGRALSARFEREVNA